MADRNLLQSDDIGAAPVLPNLWFEITDTDDVTESAEGTTKRLRADILLSSQSLLIKTAYENSANTNAYTDAEKTKLGLVDETATPDQSDASIKSAYEANANTNEFSDAEQTKLAAISGTNTGNEAAASTTVAGVVELSTVAETDTGADVTRAVTPASLKGSALQTKVDGVAPSANNYAHPNHSGHVLSAADGATTIQPEVVTSDMVVDETLESGKLDNHIFNTIAKAAPGSFTLDIIPYYRNTFQQTRGMSLDQMFAKVSGEVTIGAGGIAALAAGAVAGSAIARVAGSTYSTVQDMQNQFHSAGLIAGGVLSDAGGGSVAVTSGAGTIRATDDANAEILFCDFGALASTSIPVSSRRHIGVEYNGGSPQIVLHILDDWDYQTNFPIGEVYRDAGTNLHLTASGLSVNDHASRMALRSRQTMPLARDRRSGGLILGETGTRNVTMTPGALWDFLNRFAMGAVDTSASDTMITYRGDGSGGFIQLTGQTQWDNTQFDNGSGGLDTLANNRWGQHLIYVDLEGNLSKVYGTTEDNSLGAAEEQPLPGSVPPQFEHHATLIGRIIFQKGAATAARIESAFQIVFAGANITAHPDLSGLATGNDHPQYQLADLAEGETWYGGPSGMLVRQNNYSATTAPDALTDDVTLGYAVGSDWLNITAGDAYICLDATDGAAVWKKTTP